MRRARLEGVVVLFIVRYRRSRSFGQSDEHAGRGGCSLVACGFCPFSASRGITAIKSPLNGFHCEGNDKRIQGEQSTVSAQATLRNLQYRPVTVVLSKNGRMPRGDRDHTRYLYPLLLAISNPSDFFPTEPTSSQIPIRTPRDPARYDQVLSHN